MLRSASFLLRTVGVTQQGVSHRASPCLRSNVMTTRLLCAVVKKNKAKKAKKAKKSDGEENDKEEEWIANLIDTAESVRK